MKIRTGRELVRDLASEAAKASPQGGADLDLSRQMGAEVASPPQAHVRLMPAPSGALWGGAAGVHAHCLKDLELSKEQVPDAVAKEHVLALQALSQEARTAFAMATEIGHAAVEELLSAFGHLPKEQPTVHLSRAQPPAPGVFGDHIRQPQGDNYLVLYLASFAGNSLEAVQGLAALVASHELVHFHVDKAVIRQATGGAVTIDGLQRLRARTVFVTTTFGEIRELLARLQSKVLGVPERALDELTRRLSLPKEEAMGIAATAYRRLQESPGAPDEQTAVLSYEAPFGASGSVLVNEVLTDFLAILALLRARPENLASIFGGEGDPYRNCAGRFPECMEALAEMMRALGPDRQVQLVKAIITAKSTGDARPFAEFLSSTGLRPGIKPSQVLEPESLFGRVRVGS